MRATILSWSARLLLPAVGKGVARVGPPVSAVVRRSPAPSARAITRACSSCSRCVLGAVASVRSTAEHAADPNCGLRMASSATGPRGDRQQRRQLGRQGVLQCARQRDRRHQNGGRQRVAGVGEGWSPHWGNIDALCSKARRQVGVVMGVLAVVLVRFRKSKLRKQRMRLIKWV